MRSKHVSRVLLFVVIPVFLAIVSAAVYSQQEQEIVKIGRAHV